MAAAVVLVTAIVAAGVAVVRSGGDSTDRVDASADDDQGGLVAGDWRDLPTTLHHGSELSPFATALDDDRVLVIYLENGGGDVAGEIIDVRANTATPIAPSALEWRAFALVGWTGTEVVIAGGSNGPGIDVAAMAYNPSTDEWRRLAEPPGFIPGRSENQVVGPGVWTGTELVSWQSGLAYNPATDTWRRIAESPLAPRMDEAVVATPTGVLVWGGCDRVAAPNCDDSEQLPMTDGAFYDPATDSWEMLAEGPLGGGVGALAVSTSWQDRVLIAVPEPADPSEPSVAAVNPSTMDWVVLPSPPEGAPGRDSALVWTGTHAVMWGGYVDGISAGETDAGFALDPSSKQWFQLEPGGRARRGHAAIWTPHGLFIAGGSSAAPVLFTPEAGSLGS